MYTTTSRKIGAILYVLFFTALFYLIYESGFTNFNGKSLLGSFISALGCLFIPDWLHWRKTRKGAPK